MRKSFGSRNARRVCRLVLATAAATAVAQSGYAQTFVLSTFEVTNTFNDGPDPAANFTFTPGETTIGVTEGVNSLKVDVTPSTPDAASYNQVGGDWDNKPELMANHFLSLDVTNPGPTDLNFQFQFQGDNGGYVNYYSPTMVAPAGADKLTLTWDYSAIAPSLTSSGWWQNRVHVNNPGAATTFYIDNFRVWGGAVVVTPFSAEWANPAGGNWGDAVNWDPNTDVPNSPLDVATLGTYGGTITGSPTVTMAAPAQVATLYLDTASDQGYTIGGSSQLTINSSTDDGAVHVLSGQHTISAPFGIADHMDNGAVIEVAAGAQLTVTDFRTEWNGVAKTGDGTLLINSIKNNTLAVNAGTVKLTADATGAMMLASVAAGATFDIDGHLYMSQWWMSGASGSTINLGAGGTINIANSGGVVDSDIVGTGVIEVVSGGEWALQSSTSTFIAPLNVVAASTLTVNNGGALGDAANTINLDNGAFRTTGPIFEYGRVVNIASGGGTINTDTHQAYLGVVTGSGALTKMGTGTLSPYKVTLPGQLVTVAGGVLQIPANGTNDATSVMGNLSLDDGLGGTGSFDLTNNKAIIEGGDLATVRSQVIAGYNGGSWDGIGIISSTALANPGRAIGYANAGSIGLGGGTGTFGGISVNTGNIVLAYTLQGDSNIDFTVDSVDFGYFVAGYGLLADARWDQGDYNYDGKVTTEDFNFLAGNHGQTITFPAAALGAVVPEPSSVLLLAAPLMLGLGRRRR